MPGPAVHILLAVPACASHVGTIPTGTLFSLVSRMSWVALQGLSAVIRASVKLMHVIDLFSPAVAAGNRIRHGFARSREFDRGKRLDINGLELDQHRRCDVVWIAWIMRWNSQRTCLEGTLGKQRPVSTSCEEHRSAGGLPRNGRSTLAVPRSMLWSPGASWSPR